MGCPRHSGDRNPQAVLAPSDHGDSSVGGQRTRGKGRKRPSSTQGEPMLSFNPTHRRAPWVALMVAVASLFLVLTAGPAGAHAKHRGGRHVTASHKLRAASRASAKADHALVKA